MRRSVLIVAAAIFLVTHATNLQVPLYGTYAKIAGFGSGISAIAFSTYVAGLLPTLILLGGVSERVGRKKVILVSLLSLALATFLMIAHPSIYTLIWLLAKSSAGCRNVKVNQELKTERMSFQVGNPTLQLLMVEN